jgi:hypothetical protein
MMARIVVDWTCLDPEVGGVADIRRHSFQSSARHDAFMGDERVPVQGT